MKTFGRLLFVAMAAGWVLGSPVTARARAAQIKNPIEAAKEAFKKAREQEEAKRRQQPPRPQQPTQAPVSPSASGGATAECCSPEALGKLAASVDVVGVKLGMTLEQELVGDFWTSIQSIGLKHISLALTVDFVRRENENAIKQQEDAGAKRAASKL